MRSARTVSTSTRRSTFGSPAYVFLCVILVFAGCASIALLQAASGGGVAHGRLLRVEVAANAPSGPSGTTQRQSARDAWADDATAGGPDAWDPDGAVVKQHTEPPRFAWQLAEQPLPPLDLPAPSQPSPSQPAAQAQQPSEPAKAERAAAPSRSSQSAADSGAPREPLWWAWAAQQSPSQARAYERSGGYVCPSLNNEFTPPVLTGRVGGDGVSSLHIPLHYGPWRVRRPRFIRQGALEWWIRHEVFTWRFNEPCAREAMTPNSNGVRPKPSVTPAIPGTAIRAQLPQQSPAPSPLPPAPAGWERVPQRAGAGKATTHTEDLSRREVFMSDGVDLIDPTWLYFCEPKYTQGSVDGAVNARVALSPDGQPDCGAGFVFERLTGIAQERYPMPGVPGDVQFSVIHPIFWAVMPATWTLQHWMENTLPKMAQVNAGLQLYQQSLSRSDGSTSGVAGAPPSPFMPLHVKDGHVNWTGAVGIQELLSHRFPMVEKLYAHLGMTAQQILDRPVQGRVVAACDAPPLHPHLWQKGQAELLRVVPKPVSQRRVISYCSRNDQTLTENLGRQVLNEDVVLDVVRAFADAHGFEVDMFRHTNYTTVDSLIDYFSDVRLFIGPHGGCLSNVVFLPCGSAVVEFLPLDNEGKPAGLAHPGMMMFMQSSFLEQEYWLLPVRALPVEPGNNIEVPIDEIADILAAVLGAPPPTSRAAIHLSPSPGMQPSADAPPPV